MITLTEEQAEQLCDRCHHGYVKSQEELEEICESCPLNQEHAQEFGFNPYQEWPDEEKMKEG